MKLIESIRGEVINWIPHPSDPGSEVNKLLKQFETNGRIEEAEYQNSAKQLITLKRQIRNILQ